MNGKGRLSAANIFHLRQRTRYAAVMIALIFTLLVVRLVYLQLYKGEELRLRSETNSIRLRKITPARGLIMDSRGKVLVENTPSFNVIYVPNRTRSHLQIKEELQRIYREESLNVPPGILKLQEGPLFVPIRLETTISREKLAVIETNSHLLPGVFI
ncbi:MAG: hypothetical protein U1C55_00160, partial [Smithellaceae bacterium]|nr:hypothetical protein [Smithellaceae bacterium]